MKFCSSCGSGVELRIPEGDDRERFVCSRCEIIHYVNPRVIVGALAVWEDRVLLCRRAIEPRARYWTLPAGFMENGETTPEGAARETWEEARARLDNLQLYRVFDVPYISQVYMFYRSDLQEGAYGVGPESLEVELFREEQIPWDDIAFPVVRETLVDYFDDRRRGDYPVRVSAIEYRHRLRNTAANP
jgi:ADP-ribose pyrophosphatase YjhB (NUDIX family)